MCTRAWQAFSVTYFLLSLLSLAVCQSSAFQTCENSDSDCNVDEKPAPKQKKSILGAYFSTWVHNETVWDEIATILRAGGAVHIDNVLNPAIADQLWQEMDSNNHYERMDGNFPHYHYSGTTLMHEYEKHKRYITPTVHGLYKFLNSKSMLEKMSSVAGIELVHWSGKISHNTPQTWTGVHTDVQDRQTRTTSRRVAWVLHMCKGWDSRWGGDLIMFQGSKDADYHQISCGFNGLTIFQVSVRHSAHMVLPVSEMATQKRLAHQGWWQVETNDISHRYDTGEVFNTPEAHHIRQQGKLYINGVTGDTHTCTRGKSAEC